MQYMYDLTWHVHRTYMQLKMEKKCDTFPVAIYPTEQKQIKRVLNTRD